MEKENNVIEVRLSDFWKVLKRCWWLLMAVVVLFSGAAYLIMDRTHVDQYESTAKIYVIRTDGRTQASDANLATAIIDDCEKLILSEDNVIIPAIKMLAATEYSPAELKARITSILQKVTVKNAGTDSHLIYITVTSGTAEGAQKLANAIAQASADYLNDLFNQDMVNIADSAKLPKKISNPISLIKIALVGLAAAAVVYLVWLVLYLFDDRIDSEEKVEKRLGLTILGSIPYQGGSRRRKNRYGSEYGYYGYGYGEQQKAKEALTSENGGKEANK